MARKKLGCEKKRLHMCCSYSETGVITMLNSVARIRLMKAEKPSVFVMAKSKVCRSVIVTR
jgi:hypothetical protein